MAVSRNVNVAPGIKSPQDLAAMRTASRAACDEYVAVKARFAAPDRTQRPTGVEYDRLRDRLQELPAEYAAALPTFTLSRCPYCQMELTGLFDPWGFDGYWWVPQRRGEVSAPSGCEHFRVLLGAVWLKDMPPIAGPFEAQLGPDTPYVIPRLLRMPTMKAVIHGIPMEPGYMAYPIAYFSLDPSPSGSLTQGWVETSYSFLDANGDHAWMVCNDPWDFDLAPWIASGHVRWTIENNPDALFAPQSSVVCPYGNPKPVALPQTAENNTLGLNALPNNETVEPFE